MKTAPYPVNESLRQAAVERLQLLGVPPEESFDRVTRLAARLLGTPIAAFSVISENRQYFKSSVGLEADSTSRDIAFCAHAILSDAPLIIADASQDARFVQNPLVDGETKYRFYAGVPVRGPDLLPVGALCVVDREPRQITGEELTTLTDLAAIVERELVLRSLVRTDALTGLYNRRYFDLEIDREWRRAVRQQSSVAALLIDIDCFQDYNDTYGREQGDTALRKVADILGNRFLRSGDMLVRYNGGEFLAILLDTSLEAATALAAEVCGLVAALDIPHAYSPHGRLTASIGGTVACTQATLARGHVMLVRETGVALYAAKGRGRNQVVVHEAEAEELPVNGDCANDQSVTEADQR